MTIFTSNIRPVFGPAAEASLAAYAHSLVRDAPPRAPAGSEASRHRVMVEGRPRSTLEGRNAAICAAIKRGRSYAQVASNYGLAVKTIYAIVSGGWDE